MILQALNSYYERLAADYNSGVAPEGFSGQPVGFALELSEDGALTNVYDLREDKGKNKFPVSMILPSLGEARGSGIKANFLWGNATYVLGRDNKGKPERSKDCQKSFYDLHHKLLAKVEAKEAKAFLNFLEKPAADHSEIEKNWADIVKANLVFRLRGQTEFLHEYGVLGQYWEVDREDAEALSGVCLVTGEKGMIAKLHPAIKGIVVPGARAEMFLCSYNQDAFCSFGKKKNLNGPVGSKAAFGYTTALNYLLRRPAQCVRLGVTTVLAWAERPSVLEEAALGFFAAPEPGDKVAATAEAATRLNVLRRLVRGLPVTEAWPDLEPEVEMRVLGLAPSAARLSVSFYLTGSAEGFLKKVRGWYADLNIQKRYDREKDFPSVYEIAKAALGKRKEPKDVKRLGEDLLKAALAGGRYPAYLLPMCLNRLRAGDNFLAVHAALIKAVLIRNLNQEVSMSLNTAHPIPAYQLGRLFALLVLVQKKAIGPNINADIRDKYFGSASATPALVFPLLIRNAQNHISKAKAYGYDKMIGGVLDKIGDAFPHNLSLEDQGLFALGYYHQLADKKIEDADKDSDNQGAEE
ncbi:MAG: type I-C CRISPR-associated protein Cas8c/Csd1 [Candidatus Adiutrix sp.]|nr:type I-C CRISPR-associated protein Cas8c/Csd1 [Candidatus Adiutrix sp.]